MRKFALYFFLLSVLASAGETGWLEDYQTGLKLLAESRHSDAIVFFHKASNARPVSEIIRQQDQIIEYFPYLQLGICYHHLGNLEIANQYFELERKLGTITESETAMAQLQQFDSLAQKLPADESHHQLIREFQRKPGLLSNLEVQGMKEEIRKRCRLEKKDERSYPWYFHYELGLALKEKNDWQRALDSFITALDNRSKPNKFARTYGVWYVHYFPYYQIGLAHYNLQNWKCAASSFRLSEMLENISTGDEEYRSLQEHKTLVEERLRTERP